MLNTIYEEFDFESKIKDLKNKRIKIKRYVKNTEEIKTGITGNIEKIQEEKKINLKVEQTAPRKKNNSLFHSSSIKLLHHDNKENEGIMDQPEIRRGKGEDVSVHDRLKEKLTNPLFMSQNNKPSLFSQDIQQMVLPKLVQKILNDEGKNTERVLNHLKNEQLKIDLEFDTIIQDILDICNASRSALHIQFDQFSKKYIQNYYILKQKVQEFREISSNNLISELQEINIFYNQNKIKTDNCKIRASIDYLEKEVQKKMLNLCADELHKQTYHLPQYCNQDNNIDSIRDNVRKYISQNIKNLENQVQKVEIMNFENLEIKPEVSTVISEDQLQVLWSKNNFKLTLDDQIQTNHSDSILCILQISEDRIATGSADGSIEIWDIQQKSLIQTLSQKQAGVHTLQNILGNVDKKNFNTPQKKYLVSGHNIGDPLINVWDLDSGEIVRSFKGHTDTITALICFNDKQTIISSSQDGKIIAWNIIRNKQIYINEDHQGGVNCLKLIKNGFYMISGGVDRYINVYKVIYEFDSQTKNSFFQNCEFEKKIQENGVIYSLNHSSLNPNMIFSTSSDCSIKVWNILSGQCEKTIIGGRQPIGDLIIFENPFDSKKDKKYSLLSLDQEGLSICNQNKSINSPVQLGQQILNYWSTSASPSLQVLNKDGQILLVLSQQEEKIILIIKIQ